MKTKLQKYDKYKTSGLDWLGDIPDEWEVKRVKDCSNLLSGETITANEFLDQGDYPVYGGNGLRGFVNKYTNNGNYILIGRQGALCGNINYVTGKFFASEHAVVVYPKPNIVISWYRKLLEVMNLNQYSVASAQPGLSVERIKNLVLPLPPLQTQITIANY